MYKISVLSDDHYLRALCVSAVNHFPSPTPGRWRENVIVEKAPNVH